MSDNQQPTFYEFFAGGGMARAGLTQTGWTCLFANDFDAKKVEAYVENWGSGEVVQGDVRSVTPEQLPGYADLIWASFPCQDLSLAGGGAGLLGNRSGTFWPFWKVVRGLLAAGRAPNTIVLENVCGTLTSHGGNDFRELILALAKEGYRVGAMVIDASHFVPQSRPRLFVVGTKCPLGEIVECVADGPIAPWHTKGLIKAYDGLPQEAGTQWVWWKLPAPKPRSRTFKQLVEPSPNSGWHSEAETAKILAMMSETNRQKVEAAKSTGRLEVGTVYRRTRHENGFKVQRAEVRFDDMAGCLRTPAGGSSRQIIMFVEGAQVRTRLITARETARLMGLEDSYRLPDRYNEAYHLTGDGVAVPVVEFLSENLLRATVRRPAQRMVA